MEPKYPHIRVKQTQEQELIEEVEDYLDDINNPVYRIENQYSHEYTLDVIDFLN